MNTSPIEPFFDCLYSALNTIDQMIRGLHLTVGGEPIGLGTIFNTFLVTCIIKVLTGTADDEETKVFSNNYYGDDDDL